MSNALHSTQNSDLSGARQNLDLPEGIGLAENGFETDTIARYMHTENITFVGSYWRFADTFRTRLDVLSPHQRVTAN